MMDLEEPPGWELDPRADELSALDGMTPCPHGCGAHFHGLSVAYVRHQEDRRKLGGRCPDGWSP